jgi:hypothetical protein
MIYVTIHSERRVSLKTFIIVFIIGVERLAEYLETANHVFEVEISERVAKETLELFRERLAANKPKKGKKKGKKRRRSDIMYA